MRTEKKMRLESIKYCITAEGAVQIAAIIKHENGKGYVFLTKDDACQTIKTWVKKFDMAITNVDTRMMYVDFVNNVSLEWTAFYEDMHYTEYVVKGLEDTHAKTILEISSMMKELVNCNILNIGFSLDMNTLCIKGEIDPVVLDKLCPVENEQDILSGYDFSGNSIMDNLKAEYIRYAEGVALEIYNNWGSEWYNGPQSFGAVSIIDEGDICIEHIGEEDFTVASIDKICEYYCDYDSVVYDENTLIQLKGNERTGVYILASLKNRDFLKGFIDEFDGLSSDISNIMKLEYNSHEEFNYTSLLTIQQVYDFDAEYKEFMSNRRSTLMKNMVKMRKGVEETRTPEDMELPFH